MTKEFLPEGYTVPQSSGQYMKLQDGENKILPLDSIIKGFEYWTNENKPVRSEEYPKETPDIRLDKDDNPTRIKHFWAFPVWNSAEKKVQVLEITQKSIMGAIQALARSEDWGNPIMEYQISITKSGEGLATEYQVMPNPKKSIPDEILKQWEEIKEAGFDLTRLYEQGNPFKAE